MDFYFFLAIKTMHGHKPLLGTETPVMMPHGIHFPCLNKVFVCASGRGEGMLSRFLEVLVRKLLLDSGAGDLTGLAADALLPLILAHPHAYQHIGVLCLYSRCSSQVLLICRLLMSSTQR